MPRSPSRKSPSPSRKSPSRKYCTVRRQTMCIKDQKVCNTHSGRCVNPVGKAGKTSNIYNYGIMTVPLLKILCKDAGIVGFSKMRKADLVATLNSL